METKQTVGHLINCLTQNEDLRQELWVHYLSGNTVDSFVSHLKEISTDYSEDETIRANIWHLINNPPSDRFQNFLKTFSEFEQSILVLLALGMTTSQISAYKGISEVRIRQTISSIRYNISWEQFYGIKEKPNT